MQWYHLTRIVHQRTLKEWEQRCIQGKLWMLQLFSLRMAYECVTWTHSMTE